MITSRHAAQPMSPAELRTLILHLQPSGPISRQLESDLFVGPRSPWYRDQREHLLGWLAEYAGPGAYGRANGDRCAAFVYNHFQCPPGLAWLAEAAGVERDLLMSACQAARVSGPSSAARCGAFRRLMPWVVVEACLRWCGQLRSTQDGVAGGQVHLPAYAIEHSRPVPR